ncbi:unnamed protein product [Dimorphilus gyrociliatus]|nr:unnamed protein product [Dimorphilus gyrociliatus]
MENIDINRREFNRMCNSLKKSSHSLKNLNLCNTLKEKHHLDLLTDLLVKCNCLKNINLSNNEHFGSDFIGVFNALESSSSSLLSIDISSCFKDEENDNPLSSLLSHCSLLRKIKLSGNHWNQEGFERMCNALKSPSRNLLSIDVSLKNLDKSLYRHLGSFLSECTKLQEIQLSDIGQSVDKEFEKICNGLESSSETLLSLSLRSCDIDGNNAFHLSELLMKCTSLQKYKHEGREADLLQNDFENICNGLTLSARSLVEIDFSNAPILAVDSENSCLNNLIFECKAIKIVYVPKNIDITLLAVRFKSLNRQLLINDQLFYNIIGNLNLNHSVENLKTICNFLKSSTKYISSVCLCNAAGDKHIEILCDFFRECHTLRSISLTDSSFGRDFHRVCMALKLSSKSLRSIHLCDCSLEQEDYKYVGSLLSECKSLQEIKLSYDGGLDDAFKIICNGLKSSSHSLLSIDFSRCAISYLEFEPLLDLFDECESLQKIDISGHEGFDSELANVCSKLNKFASQLLLINLGNCDVHNFSDVEGLQEFLSQCFSAQNVSLSLTKHQFRDIEESALADGYSFSHIGELFDKFMDRMEFSKSTIVNIDIM